MTNYKTQFLPYPFSCLIILCVFASALWQCTSSNEPGILSIEKDAHIVLLGNNLCSRMMNFGHFETEMHLRYPDNQLFIRNMCDGGNTPGFRPHSGRFSPWAFPGAEKFQTELANFSNSQGHFETPDQWLTKLEADIILAFFGYNESFEGPAGVANFKGELNAFIQHTSIQEYNGESAPQLVLVSPIAFQNLYDKYDLPDGKKENANLALYAEAIKEIAAKNNVPYVDAFAPSKKWFATGEQLTNDGSQLNDAGYKKLSNLLAAKVFGGKLSKKHEKLVQEAVMEKNWFWHDDYKSPNGVHVFGRRYNPFGPDNYPDEIKKKVEMTAVRDQAIWQAAKGKKMDLAAADAKTHPLAPVQTNYKPGDYGRGENKYLYGQDALDKLETAPGYKVELFASEKEFPDLANPVQMAFDNKGRLWVAVMPTYPHYKPGDAKPNDKLIILEDTDGDYKADKQTVWADNLHIPVGFEFAPEGVYVSQGTNLKLYTDTDGDDKADKEEIIMSGFDDHDTHHVISAFCADPSGALYMGEGVFLHTNVETSYGPVRGTNGGFYRFSPQRRHLERTAQLSIPNPWGIAFDDWGQNIFAETSGPAVRWMMPGSVKPRYGKATHKSFDLVEQEHKVRPTSGLEFVSSSHFPDDVQGDLLLNNDIGFLGMKQHQIIDDGTGYKFKFRQDLIQGSDTNFRPVDMEFAPDGSLYFLDWHNVLIGHMQHNARDPLRDHVHGRVYRITYPSRPLVEPAKIVDASIEELLDNLKLPEYRTRYRTRRELRARNADEVLSKLGIWIGKLDTSDANYEHQLLEALWVTWGLNKINKYLLKTVLKAKDFRARTAAVKVLRYAGHQIDNQADLLLAAAKDPHGRVRLEALVAASWLDKANGLKVVNEAGKHELDEWMVHAHETALAHLNGENVQPKNEEIRTHLEGAERDLFVKGKELYEREAYCGTCHQEHGQGLAAAGYPPLKQSKWVRKDADRLIKLTLKGIYGPMTVMNRDYPGTVPMTPFEGLMNDEEIAAVLTYVRNTFDNKSGAITPEQVKTVRTEIADKEGFYIAAELLKEHPHKGAKKDGKLVN
ncbi:MAG: PVC-type heme-binding CxxCH protein [Saprospiraceae bacterium]